MITMGTKLQWRILIILLGILGLAVKGTLQQDCEDGPRTTTYKAGSFGIGRCFNTNPVTRYFCRGPCPDDTPRCVAIPNGDKPIPMATLDGEKCPDYINPIIEKCDCVEKPGNGDTCVLVPLTIKEGDSHCMENEQDCTNSKEYSANYCQGGCVDPAEKCTGEYDAVTVTYNCEDGTSFTESQMTATKCDCK